MPTLPNSSLLSTLSGIGKNYPFLLKTKFMWRYGEDNPKNTYTIEFLRFSEANGKIQYSNRTNNVRIPVMDRYAYLLRDQNDIENEEVWKSQDCHHIYLPRQELEIGMIFPVIKGREDLPQRVLELEKHPPFLISRKNPWFVGTTLEAFIGADATNHINRIDLGFYEDALRALHKDGVAMHHCP
jgi:hypothetical protein